MPINHKEISARINTPLRSYMETNLVKAIAQRCPVPVWLRRLGIYGFLFFLLKGVAWLTLPALLVMMGR